ncbi:hypothetical protein AGABI1DRAFT_126080 [Agaricus bisporus var. burnettii JB137-S8]|uniref:Uncharacterized protein n=1 Tax=Agaricus bisporus var. burnettii (strain JB137-S8 / ATCC MYA-4627 / FGSC 10392) TaxID=597362 RepID=K5XED2_AGABU|nr:uncharacterized protein AGABI1DRAFT_126080 [Agaricus bisporus var. burnettii JB137-S8]EKM81718.1 hypothetical protein AGABI1DRAFT_126080 [Agaricus bisporus var. burnettii JB137-S8]
MSIIARDPNFTWSSPLANDASSEESSSSRRDVSHTKQIERRLVKFWKTLTNSTRKQERVSIYAKDFVFVTSAASRRRSNIMALQTCREQAQHQSQLYPTSSESSASLTPPQYSTSVNSDSIYMSPELCKL